MLGSEAMIELAQKRVEQELAAQIAAVRQAAQRQQEGEPVAGPRYCRCGEEISAARLQAVPQTKVCVECAAKAERRAGGRR